MRNLLIILKGASFKKIGLEAILIPALAITTEFVVGKVLGAVDKKVNKNKQAHSDGK